jgi:FkbM family methyltransferase
VGPEGTIVAVEPEARNVALLKANLWRNECSNAIVLPIAAGQQTGFLPLRYNEENRGDHQTGLGGRIDRLVPAARLDDMLMGRRVDFLKIDTQGSDHNVIAGLSQVIASSSPTILCEFWPQGLTQREVDPMQVARGYQQAGFRLHLLGDQASLRVVEPSELVRLAVGDRSGYVNVVLRRSV